MNLSHLLSVSFFLYLTCIFVCLITEMCSSCCHILIYRLAPFHESLFLTIHLSYCNTLSVADPATSCLNGFDFIPNPVLINTFVLLR